MQYHSQLAYQQARRVSVRERVILRGGQSVPMRVQQRVTSQQASQAIKMEPGKLYAFFFDVKKPPKDVKTARQYLGKAFIDMRKNGLTPVFWYFSDRRLIVQGRATKAAYFPLFVIGLIIAIAVGGALFFGIQTALKEVAIGITAPIRDPKAAVAFGISAGIVLLLAVGAAFAFSRPSIQRGAREAVRFAKEEIVQPGITAGKEFVASRL